MTQRQPRVEDPAHLAYVRTFPCLVCGKPGPSDPAHIRSAAPRYGKRRTGMGEKPDDKWTLPLCRHHHDEQHRESELGWWAGKGIVDPFAVALALYASRPGASNPPTRRARAVKPVPPRKPKAERRPVPKGRDLESRSNWPEPGTRKIPTRKADRP